MDTKDLNMEDTSGLEEQNDQTRQSAPLNEESGSMNDEINNDDSQDELAKTKNEKLTQDSKLEDNKPGGDLSTIDTSKVKPEKSKESVKKKKDTETDTLQEEKPQETNIEENEIRKEDKEIVSKEKDEKDEEEEIEQATKTEIPEDLNVLNKKELVSFLDNLLITRRMLEIKDKVEEIKIVFYKKHNAEIQDQKNQFIQSGGLEEDFDSGEDNTEIQFKELYKKFKELKSSENIELEKVKEENLKVKHEIIEEIKDLINRKESINKTFQEFRELQNKWREIGLVPQGELRNLWETYHHNVEKFYDYIKINRELRDLDLKKNLEKKMQLCERAEALLLESNAPKAFKVLQELHNQYREIGPVPGDKKEEMWLRFKESTTIINKKHQDYYETLKEEQLMNLEAKKALCEKVEEINLVEYHKPKKWEEKTNEVIDLQRFWKTIGFAPKRENNKIYKRFKTTCDLFFKSKREFYEKNKEEQKNNLQLKTDLCFQAEAFVDSKDWKDTTKQLIELQKKWKEIGPVPRKYSESIWKRFRGACDTFFQNKSEYYTGIDEHQEENLKKKEELIEIVKTFIPSDDNDENLKHLMSFQKEWTEIGFVPLKVKDEIQKKFREAVNAHLENLNIDKNERALLKFRQRIEQLSLSNSMYKIENENNKIINSIREIESEITLYENNIGFFAKSKNAEILIGDVTNKIKKAKNEIELLKSKLKIINEL